jgi:hypothetical protein
VRISCRDIGPGENFQVSIVRAIRAAKVMVLVFSGNANNSEEIKKELVLAGQARLIVIPVRLEDVTPDEAFAYEFATRQWVDLFGDWEQAIQQLVHQLAVVEGIEPVLGAETATTKPKAPSVSPPQVSPPPVSPPPPVEAAQPMACRAPEVIKRPFYRAHAATGPCYPNASFETTPLNRRIGGRA